MHPPSPVPLGRTRLASAVAQAVLTDDDVLLHAKSFIRRASEDDETRKSLVSLVVSVLAHADTLAEVTTLGQHLVGELAADPQVKASLAALIVSVLQETATLDASVALLGEMLAQEQVHDAALLLLGQLLEDASVAHAVEKLLTDASLNVLADEHVLEGARGLLNEVVKDTEVQRTGGLALSNAIAYSMTRGAARIFGLAAVAGAGIVLVVGGLMK